MSDDERIRLLERAEAAEREVRQLKCERERLLDEHVMAIHRLVCGLRYVKGALRERAATDGHILAEVDAALGEEAA